MSFSQFSVVMPLALGCRPSQTVKRAAVGRSRISVRASSASASAHTRDGTGFPGHRVSDFDRVGSGRVTGQPVSVSDPVFDPVLSFNMRVYRGVASTE